MSVRRTASLAVSSGLVASYVHGRVADGVGKIGVIVALDSKVDAGKLAEIGRQIALHIAAANPQAASVDQLDKAVVERERSVYTEQALATGKAKEFVDKIVEGRLRKEFFGQVVLTEQTFMGPGGDGKMTVAPVPQGRGKGCWRPDQGRGLRALSRSAKASRRRRPTSPPKSRRSRSRPDARPRANTALGEYHTARTSVRAVSFERPLRHHFRGLCRRFFALRCWWHKTAREISNGSD